MKEFIRFFILILSTVVCLHLLPVLKIPFFIVILILFWNSKKNYFWLAFIFFIVQAPGGLFFKPYNHIIQLTHTVGIEFIYAFIFIALIKTIYKTKIKNRYVFKQLKFIPIYMIFLLGISVAYGMNAGAILKSIYIFMSVVFMAIMPALLSDKDSLLNLLKILYLCTIVLFIWQLYDILFSAKIALLCGVENSYYKLDSSLVENNDLIRIYYSPTISFISFVTGLYYILDQKSNEFNKKYLYLVVGVSFFSIFLTATRGYTLQYLFILICFSFLAPYKGAKIFSISTLLLTLIILIFPMLLKHIQLALLRFETLPLLFGGDSTAGGTLIRSTVRAPRVWNQYIHSPIWGYGFSTTGNLFYDGHVGNYTLLLEGGVIGALVYIYIIASVLIKTYKTHSLNYKRKMKLFMNFVVLSIVIAHSSSSIVFTYYLEPHLVLMFAMILQFIQYELLEKKINK